MEPEGSSPCSQKPASGPYPEPAEYSSPYRYFILPSLPIIDMTYCTADTKATPASNFRLIWIPLLHNVVKRVRNRTARFRSVFCSADGYGVSKNWVSLGYVRLG
jgi:hypothetical protein